MAAGRLLLVPPFPAEAAAPNARRAAWFNHCVLARGDRLVIGHFNPDGMLACILAEADPDMEIVYLNAGSKL
ncbi:MAG: hypothetical protein JXR37_01405 [Kiritimatiellae bacterium]|nr:hypothetical protein [Kiritimatiellia bacterium]